MGLNLPHLMMYQGSKRALSPRILPHLLALTDGVREYREPFAGAAHVGIGMMHYRPDLAYRLNDLDPCVTAVWRAVRDQPERLVERIRGILLTIDTQLGDMVLSS